MKRKKPPAWASLHRGSRSAAPLGHHSFAGGKYGGVDPSILPIPEWLDTAAPGMRKAAEATIDFVRSTLAVAMSSHYMDRHGRLPEVAQLSGRSLGAMRIAGPSSVNLVHRPGQYFQRTLIEPWEVMTRRLPEEAALYVNVSRAALIFGMTDARLVDVLRTEDFGDAQRLLDVSDIACTLAFDMTDEVARRHNPFPWWRPLEPE